MQPVFTTYIALHILHQDGQSIQDDFTRGNYVGIYSEKMKTSLDEKVNKISYPKKTSSSALLKDDFPQQICLSTR
jgi:hypothetical protein